MNGDMSDVQDNIGFVFVPGDYLLLLLRSRELQLIFEWELPGAPKNINYLGNILQTAMKKLANLNDLLQLLKISW